MPKLPKHHLQNFETLVRAAQSGHLALLECKDAKTGEQRAVIVALVRDSAGETGFVPFGHLCDGNPYEAYLPPDPDSEGYRGDGQIEFKEEKRPTQGKIKFDKPTTQALLKAYGKAVSSGLDTFEFKGRKFVTSYAKYLLEYITPITVNKGQVIEIDIPN